VVAQQQGSRVPWGQPAEATGVQVQQAEDGGDEPLAVVHLAHGRVDGERGVLEVEPGAARVAVRADGEPRELRRRQAVPHRVEDGDVGP
jgi:hypothetical protein